MDSLQRTIDVGWSEAYPHLFIHVIITSSQSYNSAYLNKINDFFRNQLAFKAIAFKAVGKNPFHKAGNPSVKIVVPTPFNAPL